MLSVAAQLNASLLQLAIIAVIIPSAFQYSVGSNNANLSAENSARDILAMSHGVAIILLVIYAAYLVFQLWSHAHLYVDTVAHSAEYPASLTSGLKKAARLGRKDSSSGVSSGSEAEKKGGVLSKLGLRRKGEEAGSREVGGGVTEVDVSGEVVRPTPGAPVERHESQGEETEEEEEEVPQLNITVTIIL